MTSEKVSEEGGLLAQEGVICQTSEEAEHTDGTIEQNIGDCPAAQQKSQEQQQELLPAEGSAEQEGTANAPVELTTRDVYPASSSHLHSSSAGEQTS